MRSNLKTICSFNKDQAENDPIVRAMLTFSTNQTCCSKDPDLETIKNGDSQQYFKKRAYQKKKKKEKKRRRRKAKNYKKKE